jgi:hypothetical protein
MLLHVFMCFGFVMVVCGDECCLRECCSLVRPAPHNAEPRLLRLKLLVLLPESSWIKDEPLHADCRCDLACQAKPTRLSQVFFPKKEKDVSNPKKELRPLRVPRECCCLSLFSSSACQSRFRGIYIRIESIKWRAAAAAPTSARSGRLFSMWQKRHPPHWHRHRHPQLHRCQRNYRIRIQQSH